MISTSTSPVVTDFLDRNYRYKSVATQNSSRCWVVTDPGFEEHSTGMRTVNQIHGFSDSRDLSLALIVVLSVDCISVCLL